MVNQDEILIQSYGPSLAELVKFVFNFKKIKKKLFTTEGRKSQIVRKAKNLRSWEIQVNTRDIGSRGDFQSHSWNQILVKLKVKCWRAEQDKTSRDMQGYLRCPGIGWPIVDTTWKGTWIQEKLLSLRHTKGFISRFAFDSPLKSPLPTPCYQTTITKTRW